MAFSEGIDRKSGQPKSFGVLIKEPYEIEGGESGREILIGVFLMPTKYVGFEVHRRSYSRRWIKGTC